MVSIISKRAIGWLVGLIILLFALGGCASLEQMYKNVEEVVANYERIENPDPSSSSDTTSSATTSSATSSSATSSSAALINTNGNKTNSYKEPTKAQIRHAQEQLKVAGFEPGPADGVAGPKTLQAIRKYQAANGFQITGLFDDKTLRSLALERPMQRIEKR
jgi:peptidoglycan hydrolase-like protein with peptidoglycan-binding domain